jgi:hypothetical protein
LLSNHVCPSIFESEALAVLMKFESEFSSSVVSSFSSFSFFALISFHKTSTIKYEISSEFEELTFKEIICFPVLNL